MEKGSFFFDIKMLFHTLLSRTTYL
jgi:hypothetical protein